MIIALTHAQEDAVLGAMRAIALAHGAAGVSAEDRATVIAAGRIVLGRSEVEPDRIAPVAPLGLAAAMLSDDDARMACRMLAVMSLVDGRIDSDKVGLVQDFAAELGVGEDYLKSWPRRRRTRSPPPPPA